MGSFFSTAEVSAMSGGIKPPAPRDYKLPTVFPSLRSAKRIAFDLEGRDPGLQTLGPGWRRGDAFICGFSLAIGDDKGKIDFADYYPCRHKDAPNLDENRLFEWLEDELSFYQGEIVGANLAYDFDGLQMRGIFAPLAKFRDVQYAEPLLDENAYDYRLERLAQNYLKRGKVTDELKALYGPGVKTRMDEVHPGHMRAYGIGDVTLPLEILPYQYKELKKQNLLELFDLECRLLPMLLYMRRKGQRVDLALAERLGDTLREKRAESLKEATRLIDKRGFELNVENFGQVSVLTTALDSLGISYPKTDKGNASIKDKWLEHLDHPFGKALAAANKYDKALETFVTGYISDFQINGRIHAEFHPLRRVDDESGKNNGTVSGRFSSSHPNLQNLPIRDPEIGPIIRAMFLPEEGYDFWDGDWSQIEFRLLVHAAVERANTTLPASKRAWNDEILAKLKTVLKTQEMYLNDRKTDFHNMVVALTGLERKYAKSITFGLAFSMGIDKLAVQLNMVGPDGLPTQQARDVLEQYHSKLPFMKALQQATTREAEQDGYICTILGRRTHFDLWEPKYSEGAARVKALPLMAAREAYGNKLKRAQTHKSLNCITQGSAGGDMMKTAMVEIWESGLLDNSDDIIASLTIHDELAGSKAKTKIGDEKLAEIKHIMETKIKLHVPVIAEFGVGKNWSETH
jgi:DNA polymerase I-like protein with 3'-5' exonuclease and polymerase domains